MKQMIFFLVLLLGGNAFAQNKIDAAVMHRNGTAFFFTGKTYLRFNFTQDQVDDREILVREWRGVPTELDAAIEHPKNGNAYFFKGNHYYRYDFSRELVDKVGRIGVDGWKGLVGNLDAAVLHPNGKGYFFKGTRYYRFDFKQDLVDKVGILDRDGWRGVDLQDRPNGPGRGHGRGHNRNF